MLVFQWACQFRRSVAGEETGVVEWKEKEGEEEEKAKV